MAGSLNHIVDDETGKFRMDLIENLGDANEALEECFEIIRFMTGGNRRIVNRIMDFLNFPQIEHNMVSGSMKLQRQDGDE